MFRKGAAIKYFVFEKKGALGSGEEVWRVLKKSNVMHKSRP